MAENLEIFDFALTPEEMDQLHALDTGKGSPRPRRTWGGRDASLRLRRTRITGRTAFPLLFQRIDRICILCQNAWVPFSPGENATGYHSWQGTPCRDVFIRKGGLPLWHPMNLSPKRSLPNWRPSPPAGNRRRGRKPRLRAGRNAHLRRPHAGGGSGSPLHEGGRRCSEAVLRPQHPRYPPRRWYRPGGGRVLCTAACCW